MFALVHVPYLGGDEMDVLPEGMKGFSPTGEGRQPS